MKGRLNHNQAGGLYGFFSRKEIPIPGLEIKLKIVNILLIKERLSRNKTRS